MIQICVHCHHATVPALRAPTPLSYFHFPEQPLPSQTFAQNHPFSPETLSLTLLSLLLLITWESAQISHPPEAFSIFPLLQVGLWPLLRPTNVPSLWLYFPHCAVIIALSYLPLALLCPWGWTPYLFPAPHHHPGTFQSSAVYCDSH